MQRIFALLFFFQTLAAQEPMAEATTESEGGGYLALEAGVGYNIAPATQHFVLPLYFTGASAFRLISTRIALLSDGLHAADYFTGKATAVKDNGVYSYNFALLDIDYLSWHGARYSAGFGGGAAHQGFLIWGEPGMHVATLRLRAQLFLFWSDYWANHIVATLPLALYRSRLDSLALVQGEMSLLWDPRGNVRNPEIQSVLLSLTLGYQYLALSHAGRNFLQHEVIPTLRVMVLY
ncbi:MAG: hypothetical protein N2Z22_08040 [Turneriella sp.]|nr:hypothetical protein [Turneriella sp.]